MKKTFTILIAAIAAILMMAQPEKVWGQTADYTYTLASGDFTTSTHTHTSGSLTWTHSHTSGTESYGWDDTYGFKFGSSNSSYPTAFKLTSSSVSNKIKKVVVTASVNSKKSCKLDVKVGSTTYGSQVTINTKNNDAFEFSIADASTVNGAVELSFSSNTGPLYLKQIDVYYYSGGGPITYTVTYNGNDNTSGSAPTDPNSPYASGSTVTVLAKPEALAKTGHTFGGWNIKADGTGDNYTAGSGTFTITANTTLYAKWDPNTHAIIFPSCSHGTPSANVVNASAVAYGTTVTLSYEHNNGDYYSASFSSTDVDIVNNQFTMPDKDVSISVTESALPVYTVTYSDGGSVTEDHYGAGVTLANRSGDGTYTFAGWSATNIPSETTTVPTIIPTNATYYPTSNITLYPVYTRTEGSGYKWVKTALSDVTAGTYALITPGGYAFNGTISSGRGAVTSSAFSFDKNNEAESAPSGTCELTLSAVTGGYTIYNSTNKYLYAKAASEGNLAWHDSESSYWKVYSSNWVYNSNTVYLRSLNNTTFRTYSNASNSEVLFAQKVANTTTYYVSSLSSIAVPSFDPTSQNFSTASLDVTITVADGCVIKYTTDGTDPSNSGTAATTQTNETTLNLSSTTTVRALAKNGNTYSSEVSQTYTRVYEVTLNSNGVAADPIEVTSGQTTTLTAPSNIPAGYSFRGWTATPESPSTLVSTTYGPTANVTLYAVFGKNTYGDFVKVTSAPSDWSGYYLIVYETGKVALNGGINSSSYDVTNNGISVTITTGGDSKKRIEANSTTTAAMFIIEKYNTAYSLKSAAGYYIGRTANSTGINAHASNVYTNTFAISSDNAVISASNDYVLRYNASSGQDRFRYYSGSSVEAIQIYQREVTSTDGFYTRVYPSNATATGNINVSESGPMLIESGSILNMGIYTLTCDDPTKLIIEDGGQLIIPSAGKTGEGVKATFQKNITHYSSTKDNYYLIANPTTDVGGIDPDDVGMLANNYDLYYFDEAQSGAEWRNYKQEVFNLVNGKGYLYAKSSDITLEFPGTVPTGTTADITLSKSGSGTYNGFNLVGNPLSNNVTSMKIGESSCSYYKVNSSTGVFAVSTDPIIVGEAFMVQAQNDKDVLTLNPSGAKDENGFNNDVIRLEVSNSRFTDVAYVYFGNHLPLTKINHLNDEAPMLYIHNENSDRAVEVYNNRGEVKSINVNFEAKTMGTYTISAKMVKGEIKYMHLYDRLTGIDTDLLVDDYSFIGTKDDQPGRFILNLESVDDNGSSTGSETFAYQSGDNIIVNGEGELQVFDVTGRMVMSQHINGAQIVNGLNNGVYVFRMEGKAQKVVIR